MSTSAPESIDCSTGSHLSSAGDGGISVENVHAGSVHTCHKLKGAQRSVSWCTCSRCAMPWSWLLAGRTLLSALFSFMSYRECLGVQLGSRWPDCCQLSGSRHFISAPPCWDPYLPVAADAVVEAFQRGCRGGAGVSGQPGCQLICKCRAKHTSQAQSGIDTNRAWGTVNLQMRFSQSGHGVVALQVM